MHISEKEIRVLSRIIRVGKRQYRRYKCSKQGIVRVDMVSVAKVKDVLHREGIVSKELALLQKKGLVRKMAYSRVYVVVLKALQAMHDYAAEISKGGKFKYRGFHVVNAHLFKKVLDYDGYELASGQTSYSAIMMIDEVLGK